MRSVLTKLPQLKDAFQALPTPQKILYGSLFALIATGIVFLFHFGNQTEYVPLYSRLSESEMATIVEALKKKKIPYNLTDGGTISVPKEQLYEVRLGLASEGLPRGGGAGFEIFDQQKLGSTEFMQKINYQRALQGELARTINEMNEVAESRVHLVLPEESLFLQDQKPASAAVVLKLESGARLNQRQIQGIVHLVASSVRGLEEDHVTILSTDGQVIHKKSPGDASLPLSGSRLEYKTQLEENLRQKVQSMLEQVLGPNRVIARVTADLDFSQIQVEQDTYDPDSSTVRSHQRSIETSEGLEASARGNPDVPINIESKLTDNQGKEKEGGKKRSHHRETVNYEMNRISRKTTFAPGSIRKLSVAVIVDGVYQTQTDASGQQRVNYVPRTPEQMKALEDIVKKAVGYDEGRGDQVTVSNVAFASELPATEQSAGGNRWLNLLKANQRILFNLVLVTLIFVFLIRPLTKKIQQMELTRKEAPQPESQPMLTGPSQEGALKLELPEGGVKSLPSLHEQALSLVMRDPAKAQAIVRSWLREGS